MQQYPQERVSQLRSARMQRLDKMRQMRQMQRTQPVLPGASSSTVPLATQSPYSADDRTAQAKKRAAPRYALRAVLQLLGIGLLLEVFSLALYPLFAGVTPASDGAKLALLGLFPWLPRLYWTTAFPVLAQILSHIPLFNLMANTAGASAANNGNANLLLALLALALLFTLLASLIGRRVLQKRPGVGQMRLLYCTALCFTALFGVTYLYAPPVLAQNVFLSGLYGRIVAVYHLNPYLIVPSSFPHDFLYPLLASSAHGVTALSGPVWIDMSIPIALFAHASVANVLLAFRVLGLGVHLLNTILVWAILARLKPETRLSAALLYGWNPLVLLFSIGTVQQEVVIVFFLLLAVLFFQRNSFLLGWVFLLLAALVNVLCLLLLPLFFRLLQREMRSLSMGRRLLWWPGCLALSSLVVVLAFAPYWSGWGLSGLDAWLALAFWPGNAINSLDAALINLPVQLAAGVFLAGGSAALAAAGGYHGGSVLAAWHLADRYAGNGAAVRELDFPGPVHALPDELALVSACTARPDALRCQWSHAAADRVLIAGSVSQLLLLAPASSLAGTGAAHHWSAPLALGVAALLHLHLADDPRRQRARNARSRANSPSS